MPPDLSTQAPTGEATGADGRESFNVARHLATQARQHPNQLALRSPVNQRGKPPIRYRELTFAELETSVARAVSLLRQRGIDRGTRTLVMVKPGQSLIVAVFALFALGAVPVVIDPGMGLRSFLKCVQRTRPQALVGIPLALALSYTFRQTFTDLQSRVCVSGTWPGSACASPLDIYPAHEDELAAILFTSGSTGAPKGVRYHHGAFEAQVHLLRETFGICPGEIDLPMLPVFALFNPALGMATIVPQMNPSRPAKVQPQAITQALLQNKVTNTFGSPALWAKIVPYAEARQLQFPDVRRVLMAGAPVPPSLLERLSRLMPQAALHTPYGATEVLPVATISHHEILTQTKAQTAQGAGTCVGQPVSGVEVTIIEPQPEPIANWQQVRPLPPGQIGEIVATGPSVTKGYDQLPEATARAKIPQAEPPRLWHRMGDGGYLDAQGRLWFCGRLAERVSTAEGSLWTAPPEGIINAQRGVLRCALVGLGETGQQVPALAVEAEAGYRFSSRDFSAWAFALRRYPPLARSTALPVFIVKQMPVDVRHNAKIHRLRLGQELQNHRPDTQLRLNFETHRDA